MEKGTNSGLLIIVCVVIFGIFAVISTFLFEDKLSPKMSNVMGIGLSQGSSALNEVTAESDFEGYTAGDYFVISKYTGNDKKVVIPKKFKGLEKGYATTIFKDTDVEEVSFQKGFVWTDFSFQPTYQSKIKKLTLPESLKVVESSIYLDYTSLTELTIPKGVSEISANALKSYGSSNDTLKKINLPEGLTKIGTNALGGHYNIKSIRIPSTVKDFKVGSDYPEGTEFIFKSGTDLTNIKSDFTYKNYKYTFY